MKIIEPIMNEKQDPIHSRAIDIDNYNVSRSRETDYNNMHHIHTSHEILFVESGQATYYIGGEAYKLSAGDILITGATKNHKREVEKVPFQRYGLTLKPSYLRSLLPEANLESIFVEMDVIRHNEYNRHVNPETFCFLITLLKILQGELRDQEAYRSTMERTIILQIILILYRVGGFKQSETPMPPIHTQMIEIKEYITNNYSEELGLKALAERFYLHPATISKCFNKYCGQNLNKYINHVRISEVTKRLERTNDSVLIIAQQCGYDSETTLARQFRTVMEISPAKYRKNFREFKGN